MNMVDLVELISPIGLQKNNAVDIMESFWELHCHCWLVFLWTLESTIEPNGVWSKRGLLVLYFAFCINEGVFVNSHVYYVAHAVGLVPDIARTSTAVCYALELCLPWYTWPFVNITTLGQLLSDDMKSKWMIEMAQFIVPSFPSIVKMIEKMASHYKQKEKGKKKTIW